MAYNELFALAFVAPYLASGKRITPEREKQYPGSFKVDFVGKP